MIKNRKRYTVKERKRIRENGGNLPIDILLDKYQDYIKLNPPVRK